MSSTRPSPAERTVSAPSSPVRRERLWPLWGVLAGLLGFAATVLFDHRPASEEAAIDAGEAYAVSPIDMAELERMPNYLGFLVGYAAIAAMIVLLAAWRSRVEAPHPRSIAARVVSAGLLVTAAGLALGYGWKGALANYGYDGPEVGLFGDEGLFVYYMMTDFGPYLPWLGVTVSAAGLAWLAWAERLVSRVLGTFAGIYAVLIAGGFVVTGVPGLGGPLGGLFLAVACAWLAFGRSRVTVRESA